MTPSRRADPGQPACVLLLLSLLLSGPAGCTTGIDPTHPLEWITTSAEGFTLALTQPDLSLNEFFLDGGTQGRSVVQEFFARSFRLNYVVRVFPDRASLSAYWRDVWRASGLDEGCFTIAAARQEEVTFLSPGAWEKDACGQDPNQSGHVRTVLTHELVHVLHHQYMPTLGQVAQTMPWFVEGLAVFASGQLRLEYASHVHELVASGYAPTRLADIWTSTWRYELAGSLVAYIDQLIGRQALAGLLTATTEAEVLAATGLAESDLLASWRANVAPAR
jgi:hypothetical protein